MNKKCEYNSIICGTKWSMKDGTVSNHYKCCDNKAKYHIKMTNSLGITFESNVCGTHKNVQQKRFKNCKIIKL